ncbi:hypothetical protein HQ560_10550 [bacterium]|nr:hypothetical protein [bacterium]
MAVRVTDELLALVAQACCRKDRDVRASDFMQRMAAVEPAERPAVLRALLERLADLNESRIDALNHPPAVLDLVHKEFARLRETLASEDDAYFDLHKHPLRCDLRIACFGRVPVGVEHMEMGGLPRSLLWRGGPRQAWDFLRMLRQTRGVRPFYELHMAHGVRPHEFLLVYSRKAQARQFRNIAACLERNPHVRGVMGSSWWFDPKLASGSPYLAYLGDFLVANGAFRFRYYAIPEGGDALANSPARQQLFDEGQYTPTSYIIAWPRASLLAWAKRR